MDRKEFDDFLLETLDDEHFSRKEKDLLKELLAETQPDENKLAQYRSQAFAAAKKAINDPNGAKILDWLEGVVKVLQSRSGEAGEKPVVHAHFAPGDDCPGRIAQLVQSARKSLDICVFTITDNTISRPILEAHKRGVKVRVLTDNDKLEELGSDIKEFAEAGIDVKIDRTEAHMHHKFAIFDQTQLLTGSYNWTRGAARFNHENFVVTNDVRLVARFLAVFEDLWKDMSVFKVQ